jgi:hypothetical protein
MARQKENHFQKRIAERFSPEEQALMGRGWKKAIGQRKDFLNGQWVIKVTRRNRVVGYICGEDMSLTTVLTAGMTPRQMPCMVVEV